MLEIIALSILGVSVVAAIVFAMHTIKKSDESFLEHMKEVDPASTVKIFDDPKLDDLTKEIQDEEIITEDDVGLKDEDLEEVEDEPSFVDEAADIVKSKRIIKPRKKAVKKDIKKRRKIGMGRPKGSKNKKSIIKVKEAEPVETAETAEAEAPETV